MPGFQELIVIAVIALLVFGPERLPEMAKTVGKTLARFRAETQRNVDELRSMTEIQELERELDAAKRELKDVSAEVRGTRPTRIDRHAAPSLRAADDPPPFDPEAT